LGNDIGDFFRQMPLSILLAPVVFGALYIGLTVYIFRRAAERRRRAKLEAAPAGFTPKSPKKGKMPIADFLRGELPVVSSTPAEWTVPAELRALPEPDLDMLTSPVLFDEEMISTSAAAPIQSMAAPVAPVEHAQEWVGALVPAPEAAMTNLEDSEIDTMNTQSQNNGENIQVGDAVEVMRIWRDINDGSLIFQMGGQRYRGLSDIKNQDLARRFVAIVRELWAMVSNGPARMTGGDAAGAVPPPTNSAGMKGRMGLLSSEPDQPEKPHMAAQFGRLAIGQSQTPKKPEPPPSGIANAVEEFLQFKLSNTPEYAARSIHIRPAPDHSVRIEVDGHYYEAIGDVVDPDVREFLFNLMREWEARH
jgi:hypothetical protein